MTGLKAEGKKNCDEKKRKHEMISIYIYVYIYKEHKSSGIEEGK